MLHSDRIVALKLKKAIVNYHNCQTYPLVYFPAQGSSSPAQGFADAQGLSATIVDALPSDIFAKEVLVKVVAPAIVKIEATAKVAM